MASQNTADAIIVGGGIAGASIAFYLAAKGFRRVLLLEREYVASGATGYAVALVRLHYTNPWEAALALRSWEVFRDWGEVIGGQCGFKATGFLNIVGPEDVARQREAIAMLKGIGVETEELSAEDLKTLQPFMSTDDVGAAAYEPGSGYADGTDAVNSLLRRARGMGVEARTEARVAELVVGGGRVQGVKTARGHLSAPVVVLAAGAWSAPLARTAGVALPITPKVLKAAILERPPEVREHMVVIDRASGCYFRPDVPGLTAIGIDFPHTGDPEESDPDHFSRYVSEDERVEAAARVSRRIPAMANARYRRTWAGVDGFSPDGKAIMGRAPGVEGLYVATAFSGTGFKTGPAVGMCMAELIAQGRASTVDIAPFALERFAEDGTSSFDDRGYHGAAVDYRGGL